MDNDWKKTEQNHLCKKISDFLTAYANSESLIDRLDENERRKFYADKLILESLQFILEKKDSSVQNQEDYLTEQR